MPYIEQDRRKKFDHYISATMSHVANAGELNYVMTMLTRRYVGPFINYTALNEVVGVLECVKQEFYRRVVATYEDEKCRENGDVF